MDRSVATDRRHCARATILLLAVHCFATSVAHAEKALDNLGRDLTPVGAERAGNAEGTIPAWDGGLIAPPAGWMPGQGYIDPFAGDEPLLTITAANAAQHAARLTAGETALLAKYPEYRMRIYPRGARPRCPLR